MPDVAQPKQQPKISVREPDAPDPRQDPVGFLLARGWEYVDGEAQGPSGRWFDPTLSKEGRYRKEPSEVVGQEIVYEWKEGRRQEVRRPIHRTYYDPPAEPVFRDKAVMTQMRRDAQGK
jgi:hypothetical protein